VVMHEHNTCGVPCKEFTTGTLNLTLTKTTSPPLTYYSYITFSHRKFLSSHSLTRTTNTSHIKLEPAS